MPRELRQANGLRTTDFYQWAIETAAALRRRDLASVDLDTIAEELEDLGRSEQRELRNRLKQLKVHLLRWKHQPAKRSLSWRASVNEQRREIERLLEDNPSLRGQAELLLSEAYPSSVDATVRQTGLAYDTFPSECPFTFDELMSADLER